MSLTILIVNNNRYLINTESKYSDKRCQEIIDSYPDDAVIDFDEVRMSDVTRKTVKDLIKV